jgi:GDP-L-fucose synthase
MKKEAKIFVAGHRGMVGSAIRRRLESKGYCNVIVRSHRGLDLTRQSEVEAFFEAERPEYVFLAAAKVGGIWANSTYPAEFIYQNLQMQNNVINSAHTYCVSKLLFLGSSCVYPRECSQPIREEYLLTKPLEPTNEAYAIAKIAGIKLCQFYHQQYNANFISVMPTNLFGPGDRFDLKTSHALPALIRKFHLARLASQGDWEEIRKDESLYGPIPDDIRHALGLASGPQTSNLKRRSTKVVLWGTGTPHREFLHVDDLADACLFVMNRVDAKWLYGQGISHLNIGTGSDMSISELASMVGDIVGYKGDIAYDASKPDGTPQKVLDVTRLTDLGWNHRTLLRDGIIQTYEWYLEHADRDKES